MEANEESFLSENRLDIFLLIQTPVVALILSLSTYDKTVN